MNPPSCASHVALGAGLSLVFAAALAACSPADRLAVGPAIETEAASVAVAVAPETVRPEGGISADTASLSAAISDLHLPRPGLYTAGQPAAAAWQAAADDGITTVINLRPMAEMGARDEVAEVAAAGLAYFEIPVAGAGDINMDNARRLEELIAQAPGPVLVHCASANRVGALLALGEMDASDVGVDQALAFGRSAGLGSLESRVREVIASTPATGCRADASC